MLLNRLLLVLTLLCPLTGWAGTIEGPWPRPNRAEAAAIIAGQDLGIGTVELSGPEIVEVRTYHTWELRYTVGPAGVATGGAILVGMRHMQHLACPPQAATPRNAGYVTVSGPEAAALVVDIPGNEVFPIGRFFPWQHIVRVRVQGEGLAPGAQVAIVLGDTKGGGPGMLTQPFDEAHYGFKVHVDAAGTGAFLPLAETPFIEIQAGAPARFVLVAPSNAVLGEPTWCLVRAEDRYGNPASSFEGEVVLSATDADTHFELQHTFTEADRGVYRFEEVVFPSAGSRILTARHGELRAISNPIMVGATAPEHLLLWGDLHGHTLYSDGRGTVEEFYDFADRVAGLDFCAVTDHAYQVRSEMWEHSKAVTNAAHVPGRFVTFNAFEWSGATPDGGDHNVFFLEDNPPIYRSALMYHEESLQQVHDEPKQVDINAVYLNMKARMGREDIFCIPHFGGRQGNPAFHDPKVQRMIEIFSEHQRSEAWATEFLSRGYQLGIMASTDGHYGNPGYGFLKYSQAEAAWEDQEIGMAAIAVLATARTRESIFEALYARRVYATSGDRIVLSFEADGQPMGSVLQREEAPMLRVEVNGTAPLLAVEIKKNSEVVHRVEPEGHSVNVLEWTDDTFKAEEGAYYYVRAVQRNGEEAISSPIWVNWRDDSVVD